METEKQISEHSMFFFMMILFLFNFGISLYFNNESRKDYRELDMKIHKIRLEKYKEK